MASKNGKTALFKIVLIVACMCTDRHCSIVEMKKRRQRREGGRERNNLLYLIITFGIKAGKK